MSTTEELFTLTLADGIPAERDGKTLRYRQVRLRETTVGDERAAVRMAERVVAVGGQPKLLVSEADFRYAMTLRHIESIACDGQVLPLALLDLDLLGRLSAHDLGQIEERVFLIEMAAELRHGLISQADFDALLSGQAKPGAGSPQPVGQVAELGQAAAQPQPGPALLADYAGEPAAGAPVGAGQ